MTHNNDQSINLTKQERKAIRSVAKKLDDKKRPSDKERDRSDSTDDFDKGVRFG